LVEPISSRSYPAVVGEEVESQYSRLSANVPVTDGSEWLVLSWLPVPLSMPKRLPTGYILLSGYDGYSIRLGPSGKYRIGLNIVRTGRIGVKGLVIEYGEYPVECNEYLPTPSLKPLSRFANQFEILLESGKFGFADAVVWAMTL